MYLAAGGSQSAQEAAKRRTLRLGDGCASAAPTPSRTFVVLRETCWSTMACPMKPAAGVFDIVREAGCRRQMTNRSPKIAANWLLQAGDY